jgi:hypothetical protein
MTTVDGPANLWEDFDRWGDHAHGSPLYRFLAKRVAEDPEVLAVAAKIEHTPRPNMLFAGVHYLLLAGEDDPLGRYYPSVSHESLDPTGCYSDFHRFALAHADRLIELGRSRYVQTNEVRRCTALMPGVATSRAASSPFHLVDVGCSAGLNLSLDRYRYDYGTAGVWGDPASKLVLTAEARGGLPTLPDKLAILGRHGLDLNPVDLADPDARMWMVALIWPEQEDRRRRLQEAFASALPVQLVAGDAVVNLPRLFGLLPAGEPVVVMHAFALNQFTPEMRSTLDSTLAIEAGRRPLSRVALEFTDSGADWPEMTVDGNQVATAHHHGEWVNWM